jgi:hypothetical protein
MSAFPKANMHSFLSMRPNLAALVSVQHRVSVDAVARYRLSSADHLPGSQSRWPPLEAPNELADACTAFLKSL